MAANGFSRRYLVSRAMSAAGMAVVPRFADAASPQCPSVAAAPTQAPPFTATPLGTLAARKNIALGVLMGIATDRSYGDGMYDPVYRQVASQERPQVIAYGSAFKFGDVCPDPPTSDGKLVFTSKQYGIKDTWYVAKDLTNFVMPLGGQGRADALIWNDPEAAPGWLRPLPSDGAIGSPDYQYNLSFVRKYMSAAMRMVTLLQGDRPDYFAAVGIVNEAVVPNFGNPQSPSPAYYRDGPWLPPGQRVSSFSGVPDYIRDAFHWGDVYRTAWAKSLGKAASTAKFYTNELLSETDQFGPVLRPAILKLLQAMLDARLPIQGVGLECHLQPQMMNDAYHPDWTAFGTFIQQIGALGLDVYITELDVLDYEASCRGAKGSTADSDALTASYFDTFLRTVLAQRAVKAITLWDLSDRYTFYRTFDVATWAGYDQIPRPPPSGTIWPNCPTLPARATAIACPRPNVYNDAMRPKSARAKIAAALSAAPAR